MEPKFLYKVNEQSFDSKDQILSVKKIVERAKIGKISVAQHSIENLKLRGQVKEYSKNDEVNLQVDKNLVLELTYQFKVNGQELECKTDKIVVSEIIKMAQEKGVALPDQPQYLLLEEVYSNRQFTITEEVDFNQCKEFLLLVNKPTPVA